MVTFSILLRTDAGGKHRTIFTISILVAVVELSIVDASVARRVHPTLREPSLGIEHHAAVAGLESQDQRFLLELAKEHTLTVPRLRKSIQLGHLVSEEELEDAGAGNRQTNHVALTNRLVRWWTSETCKAPADWNVARREAIKRDFEQILEIYGQL